MNAIQFLGAVELGLIYACVTVAVYLSFRCLDFPDLSVDGTFPLGAAICAVLIVNGFSPLFSTAMSVVGGLLAGYVTAWLSTKLKILNLLAGILTMTALYSVNLRVMKRPNVSLLNEDTFFTPFEGN